MTNQQNKLKKGYKQTEVGVVPEDWEVTPLGQISDVIMGQSPLGKTYNKAGEGVALINGPTEFTDIYPVKVQWTTHPTKICKKNDLLICVRGSSTGRMNVSDDEYCIGRGVAAIRAKSLSNTVYLTNQIHLGIERLLSLSAGSTFPNVDGKSIRSILIPLPPTKAEQTAIATALSDADALIQSLEKLIAKKRLIKQGAMQELLKPKESWAVKKLGTECELITKGTTPTSIGENFQSSGISFIKIESLGEDGNILMDKIAFIDRKTYNSLKRSQLKVNDVLISIAGALGRVAIVKKDILPANTNQALAIARLKPEATLELAYLFHFLKSNRIQKHIEAISVQGAQANLSLENINDLPIDTPSTKSEQTRIATILSDMDAEISALETKLAKYKQVKQGIMQNLLTGKIRLV